MSSIPQIRMNIVDNILFQATVQPRAPAMAAPGRGIGLISYGRLAQTMRNIAHRLSRSSIGAGTIVAVSIGDPIIETAFLLALARMGAVTVSGFDGESRATVRVDVVVTDGRASTTGAVKVIAVDLSWIEGDHETWPPECSSQTHPNDLCRIVLTADPTGAPRAVALSHGLLGARVARHEVFGPLVASHVRMFSDWPVDTSLGFQFLVYALSRGGLFLFPGSSFDDTIDAFHDYDIGCCLSSPGGLDVLLTWFERYPVLQSDVGVIVCAGDIVPKPLADRVRARICPHLMSVYGSTEADITAMAPVQFVAEVAGGVGFVMPGTVVEVVDDNGIVLPSGREGLFRVKSPCAVDRYFEDPAASAAAFHNGWFYPGNIGALDADGLLRLVDPRVTQRA